jgi:hypothetical protein
MMTCSQPCKSKPVTVCNGFDIYRVIRRGGEETCWAAVSQSNRSVRAEFDKLDDAVRYCKLHTTVLPAVHNIDP